MAEYTKDQLLDQIYDLRHAVKTLEGKLAAAEKKTAEVTKRHHDDIMSNNFSRLAATMGYPPDSISDVIHRLPELGWSVNEQGEPEFRNKKGDVDYAVTPESWLAAQLQSGGHWNYLPRQGALTAGGSGGSGGGLDTVKNPWAKDTWSDTEQALLYKANPAKAEQMAKAAGSCIGALDPRLGPSKPAY